MMSSTCFTNGPRELGQNSPLEQSVNCRSNDGEERKSDEEEEEEEEEELNRNLLFYTSYSCMLNTDLFETNAWRSSL